jgi:cytochrome c551/c552
MLEPAYIDVAKQYSGNRAAEAKLIEKVKKSGSGDWGQVPMPPNTNVWVANSHYDAIGLRRAVLSGMASMVTSHLCANFSS